MKRQHVVLFLVVVGAVACNKPQDEAKSEADPSRTAGPSASVVAPGGPTGAVKVTAGEGTTVTTTAGGTTVTTTGGGTKVKTGDGTKVDTTGGGTKVNTGSGTKVDTTGGGVKVETGGVKVVVPQ